MFFFFILFAIITRPVVSQNDSRIETFFKNIISDHPEINFILLQVYLQLPQNECVDQLQSVGKKITTFDIETLKMIDASAKPQSGVLFGNIMHMGNFDECLELNAKYCTVPFSPHPEFGADLNESMSSVFEDAHLPRKHFETDLRSSFGVCIPKICNASHLQPISDVIENVFELPTHFHFEERKCYTKQKAPLTSSANSAIIVFSIFALVILSSTLYDIFNSHEKKPNLYTAFSVISNSQKLLAKTSQEDIKCLNGINVISMMWLLVLHRIIYSFSTPNINIKQIFYWRAYFLNAFFITADMAIDTFLTINGLLVVYLFLKYRKKGVKFSILNFYGSKILRHMPSLAMAVLLTTNLLKYMGNGPFWWTVEEAQDKCEQRWWTTLFFVQNYFNPSPKEMCLTHSWYLAVNAHMYFLTPFILLPFLKWPKFTTLTVLSLVFVSATYAFAISVYHELPTTLVNLDFRLISYLYLPTHVRGVSYLVGMVCGYYLFENRNVPLKLRKVYASDISTWGKPHLLTFVTLLYTKFRWQVLTFWAFSLLTLLGIIIGHFVASGIKLSSYESAIFNSSIRIGWSLAVSIVIFLCRNGYGGVINAFLSQDVFTLLNRLNYNVYILHELTLILVSGQLRTPNYFSDLFAFHNFWGDYMFTLAMALVWNLAFESPMIAIGKYFDLKM